MSTFRQIDVLGALEAAGIQYQRSGSWVRIRAIWRESRAKDVAVHIDNGGWRDHGGLGEHGAWPSLCERLGIHCSTQTWTPEERAEFGRQMAAKRAARDLAEVEDASRRMRAARSLWERRSVSLDHPGDPHAAAMRTYIEYRGLRLETLMQVARAGLSNRLPCLVYGRRDPRTSEITTIHREWDKRTWPADAGTNKRGLGPQFWSGQTAYIEYNRWTGAGVVPGAMAAIAEGQLSAACCAELYPDSPVLSVFTMGGMERPPVTRIRELVEAGYEILILGDRGGMEAAQECARRILLVYPRARIRIAIPPEGRVEGQKKGEDWLDVRVGYEGVEGLGDEATRAMIEHVAVAPDMPPAENDGGPDAIKGTVLPFTQWREIPHATIEKLPTIQETQERLKAALPGAIEAARAGRPVLVATTTGGGKTHNALRALLAAKVEEGDSTRPLNFVWASPTKALAEEAWARADEANCGRMMNWDGRLTPGMCLRPDVVDALMKKGRSPHQQACQDCPHGKKPEGDEMDVRCQLQKNLSEAPSVRGVFGQHGIIGRESTLLKVARPEFTVTKNVVEEDNTRGEVGVRGFSTTTIRGGGLTYADRDLLALDEGVPTFSTTTVTSSDVSAARVAAGAIDEHVRELRARNLQKQKRRGREEDEARFTDKDYEKARAWGREIAPTLDKLGAALVAGAGMGVGLHQIDKIEHADFVRLGQKIPPAARVLDATALEKVVGVWGEDRVIPLAWIKTLAKAIEAGTAWLRVKKNGVDIIGTNPTELWTRFLTKGGILLDATCTRMDEILQAGGLVIDLRAAEPHLHVAQYGTRLHGKGDSGRSEKGRKRLAQEARELLAVMGNDPNVVVITHKALAAFMKDERVRHWGTHKGHNDWKDRTRLILWGLPLMNANDQIVGYKTYRAAMAVRGIDLPDWNGERVRDWVETDGWQIFPAAALPAVKEARDWLLREMNADIAQAIGRLRAVWATERVDVEIYGFLPIVGFGLHVNEMRLEGSGREHRKVSTRRLAMEAVVDLGEARTRKGISDYIYQHGGGRVSNTTIDCCVEEAQAYALRHGLTLTDAARILCQITNDLLKENGNDAMAACLAADAAGIPGATLLALVIEQGRRAQAPGAQRAGP